jgi:hypothetical protein
MPFARALPFAHLTIYPPASQLGVFSPFGHSNFDIRISNFRRASESTLNGKDFSIADYPPSPWDGLRRGERLTLNAN